jgi:uncharacterized NAD(P)/FAD-binding protein YdhS
VLATKAVLIAIIGGGASAVLLVAALEKRIRASPRPVELHIFDASNTFGRGYAYGAKSNVYVLNTSAESMSVHEEKKTDFVDWLQDRPNGLGEIPRNLYGNYLEQRLKESISRIVAEGHSVRLHSEFVGKLTIGNRHRVRTRHLELEVDHCIVATGGRPNAPDRGIDLGRYIPSAMDEEKLQMIPPGSTVGILGSGQSAIDACLFLENMKLIDRYSLISRGGVLPRVKSNLSCSTSTLLVGQHASMTEAKERVLRSIRWQTKLDQSLRAGSFRAMEADLKRALRTRPSWQTAMAELTPVINKIWSIASAHSREQFLRHDFRALNHLRSAIPPPTASNFLSIHRHARLELLSGKYRIRDRTTHFEYQGKDMQRI